MRKQHWAVALVVAPPLARAQSSNIETGISNAVPYIVGIGMAVSAVGLVFAGIKFSSGDPQAKENAKSVLIGSILIMSASAVMGIVRSLFRG